MSLIGQQTHEFAASVIAARKGEMDTHSPKRSESTHSNLSSQSQSRRTGTSRVRSKKTPSYASSSTSSVDESLTSFPSFSPGSPNVLKSYEAALGVNGSVAQPAALQQAHKRKESNCAPSIVGSLTQPSPHEEQPRSALFDDAPLNTSHIPGAIHLANDEFLGRIIARQGALNLVRQLAGDLAQRDAQIAQVRRKAEERERALRKVILECGLSSLDLEKRLRAIEESKTADDASIATDSGVGGLESLIHDAMSGGQDMEDDYGGATIRLPDMRKSVDKIEPTRAVSKNWKDFLWGSSSTKKPQSRAASIQEGADLGPTAQPSGLPTPPRKADRQSILGNGLFHPPEGGMIGATKSTPNLGKAPETIPKPNTSLAAMALKLVAGSTTGSGRDSETSSLRGQQSKDAMRRPRQASQPSSSPTVTVTQRSRSVAKSASSSRPTLATGSLRGPSPHKNAAKSNDPAAYGPVELDTIHDFKDQPPTVTQAHMRQHDAEFLTDRFGFIYDQRRKKRQREAAESIKTTKGGSPVEMITSSRGNISPTELGMEAGVDFDLKSDAASTGEESQESGKPGKKWQDYLKIATFPTELLSHTPSTNLAALEVLDDNSSEDGQRSPRISASVQGFLPPTSTSKTTPTVSPTQASSVAAHSKAAVPLAEEDIEPVKLLLKQLGEVHDALQREKGAKWNDFLRKVRAERKREGDAVASSSTDGKKAKEAAEMPEVSLGDGEMIGVAGLGNKGRIGRAKWAEFRQLILGGIPVAYRAKVWAECSGASALRVPGYYDDLISQDSSLDDPVIVSQIKMDINRTLTDNIFFRCGTGVQKLEEVLLAYSRRNKEVGYCQGLNMITACLLLIIPSAEDAFWLLASIIENILPQGYYDHSLLASRADQQVLRHYVTDILPKLSAHLDDLGIELEALTFQWFLSVFTDCLSAEALFRVWDVIFCINDGSTFLFQVALALLKLNEGQLLGCNTPAGVYSYINHQMTNHAISIDGLIQASDGLRKVVRREDVEARRSKAIEAEKEEAKEREVRNEARKAARIAAQGVKDGGGAAAAAVA